MAPAEAGAISNGLEMRSAAKGDQPCRDLNRGFSLLITSVRPFRRTICEPCVFFIEPSELRTFILNPFPLT
jgi:hypothetical protein